MLSAFDVDVTRIDITATVANDARIDLCNLVLLQIGRRYRESSTSVISAYLIVQEPEALYDRFGSVAVCQQFITWTAASGQKQSLRLFEE